MAPNGGEWINLFVEHEIHFFSSDHCEKKEENENVYFWYANLIKQMHHWLVSLNLPIRFEASDRDAIVGRWMKHLNRGREHEAEIYHLCMKLRITEQEWIDHREDILVGVSVEFEHGLECTETNVTDDDLEKTTKIAMRHLAEGFAYYRLLISCVEYWQEDVLKAPKPRTCNANLVFF